MTLQEAIEKAVNDKEIALIHKASGLFFYHDVFNDCLCINTNFYLAEVDELPLDGWEIE